MATSTKIECAYTFQDVKAQQEGAMISKLGTDINSINEGDIKNPNKIPTEAKPTQFWVRRLELEKSIFKNSSTIVNEIVDKAEKATEKCDTEVLVTTLEENIERVKTHLSHNGLQLPKVKSWKF